jgi:hypothetical protein
VVPVIVGGGGACEVHPSSRRCVLMNASVCGCKYLSAGRQMTVAH